MKDTAFYSGLALLFTHELDAMANHEWLLIPLLRGLADPVGQATFILAHVPIFAIVIASVASLNLRTRSLARDIASGFMIAHVLLHIVFSGHAAYGFDSLLSMGLIYGAGLCGTVYLAVRLGEK
jgi:Mg/Co/Ni transporter MgtE